MAWPICLGQLQSYASGYFDRVAAGETIDIIRRGKLVAHIVPNLRDQPDRRRVSRNAEPWMIRLSELRKHAARYLDCVAEGETIGIIRDGELVARLVSAVAAPGRSAWTGPARPSAT